jgi:hypothetical protein
LISLECAGRESCIASAGCGGLRNDARASNGTGRSRYARRTGYDEHAGLSVFARRAENASAIQPIHHVFFDAAEIPT